MSDSDPQIAGRWKSDSYLVYIRAQLAEKCTYTSALSAPDVLQFYYMNPF